MFGQRIDVDAMADLPDLTFHIAAGVFSQVSAIELQSYRMEPHDGGRESQRNLRRRVGRNQHVATAEVNLLCQLQDDTFPLSGSVQISIKCDDGLYLCPLSGWQRQNGVAGPDGATRNAASKSAKRGIRPDDGLHREPQRIRFEGGLDRDALQVLQQCGARVPRRMRTALDNVVALEGADGNAFHKCFSQSFGERQEVCAETR